MPITIQPLEEADIPTFVRIELEAFRPHPRIPMLWPRGYTDDLYAFYEDHKNESYNDSEQRLVKAVDDETGEIVAASEWTFVLDAEMEAKKVPSDPNEQPPPNWPKDGNWGLRTFFRIAWEEWRRKVFAGKPYIELNILVTNPAFQGRGAGRHLLSWGCEQADKLGLPMCLESTPAGLSLYARFGFEVITVIKADMKQFGWNKPYDEEGAKRFWMTREPQRSA
ncbi:hypothetical protein LTR36_000642 [Oleoguttula mirabilis]|uniref:N-acetyltransferase domain-containing protein n=1 Tax=Oleoguttula mirabilis TaxID=1507867 RepID=A0AAV9JRS4_9PEZI|nr:hypothetical protein LTR36_000642 [Oleoguttula mirabilis]